MIDLYKVGDVPYDDKDVSTEKVLTFSEAHVAAVVNDPVAATVALELTAVGNALDTLGVTVADETVKAGLQKARVAAKQAFRASLPNEVSKIYGAALGAYGQQGSELGAIFPEGREVFGGCKDALLGPKLIALHTAATAHSAALGAPMVTLANSLKTTWATVYQAAVDAKGVTGGSATARREDVRDLKTALALLRLELGKQLLRQPERLRSLFPQHLLGQPVEDSGEDEGSGGEEPGDPLTAPQNVGLIPGADGTGELGVQCDVPAGATGLKIWRENFGGSPPTLLATLTDVTALPFVLTFTTGEDIPIFMTAIYANGESEPSTTVTQTAP